MRLEEALDRYLVQLEADGRSTYTVDQARRYIMLFSRWLRDRAENIAEIGHEDIAAFMVSKDAVLRPDGARKKPSSMNALRSSLRAFFRYVHDAGWVSLNPARLLRRAICGPPTPKGLSEIDQRKLLDALRGGTTSAEVRDRALFGLMLTTGIRIGSAISVHREDVDLEGREVRLRRMKRGRDGVVFLSDQAINLIEEHVARIETGPLFKGQWTGLLSANQARRRLQELCARAGIERRVSPHRLRHAYAVALYERTGDILLVKEALGHRSIMSTLAYAAYSRSRLRQTAIDTAFVAVTPKCGALTPPSLDRHRGRA